MPGKHALSQNLSRKATEIQKEANWLSFYVSKFLGSVLSSPITRASPAELQRGRPHSHDVCSGAEATLRKYSPHNECMNDHLSMCVRVALSGESLLWMTAPKLDDGVDKRDWG
ncbi:hypothetical protein CEXT_75901 [Caerostris extrusa]|uniref:Uncharacterized protein n=1 Tax=Caerostris extrusa TaxID=172846 RepID=A0AAV4WW44_CAEEX|nr:hypothetical protein CEXT_75901 [Caerostris extrusa]